MEIFDLMSERGHEQLAFWNDSELGYRGIIAIHDTTMGPALGGTRFWNYESDRAAIIDALRLSRGMTYKAAITGLNLGGGKSVIWGDNKLIDREMIFRAHGRAVDSLGGRYITAADVGTSPDDMACVAMEPEHVVGRPGRPGGMGAGFDVLGAACTSACGVEGAGRPGQATGGRGTRRAWRERPRRVPGR